jgi:hypothetical protein
MRAVAVLGEIMLGFVGVRATSPMEGEVSRSTVHPRISCGAYKDGNPCTA